MIRKRMHRRVMLTALALSLIPQGDAFVAAGAETRASSPEIQALREEFQAEIGAVRAENQTLKDRLAVFENARAQESKRIDEIELRVEESEGLTSGYNKGFYIRSPDENFEINFGGYIQIQGNLYEDDDIPRRAMPVYNDGLDGNDRDNSFFLRRARLKAKGHIVTKKLKYALQAEFAGSDSILRDGYVSYQWNKKARLTMGQFKPPFSLENLESSSNIETIERASIVVLLGLDRRIGAQLDGEFLDGKLAYALMITNNLGFSSDGRNSSNTNDEFAYVGRLVAKPWLDSGNRWVKDLEIGLAAATGINGPPSDSSGMTVTDMISTPDQSPRVRMTVPYVGGRQTQYDASVSWVVDRFRLKGEYIWAHVGRRDVPVTDEYPFGAVELPKMWVNGGYVQASYVLQDKPGWTFVPVVKYEWMHVKNDQRLVDVTFPGGAMGRLSFGEYNNDVQALTAGVTWFVNPNFKIMANWIFEDVGEDLIGSTRLLRGEDRDQNIFLIRSQLKF